MGLYLYRVTDSVGRCKSTSSHGARCCFAQHNPVPSLLECRLHMSTAQPSELACLPQEPHFFVAGAIVFRLVTT